jgi:hypothetical protein
MLRYFSLPFIEPANTTMNTAAPYMRHRLEQELWLAASSLDNVDFVRVGFSQVPIPQANTESELAYLRTLSAPEFLRYPLMWDAELLARRDDESDEELAHRVLTAAIRRGWFAEGKWLDALGVMNLDVHDVADIDEVLAWQVGEDSDMRPVPLPVTPVNEEFIPALGAVLKAQQMTDAISLLQALESSTTGAEVARVLAVACLAFPDSAENRDELLSIEAAFDAKNALVKQMLHLFLARQLNEATEDSNC